jgi:hypothetical protein
MLKIVRAASAGAVAPIILAISPRAKPRLRLKNSGLFMPQVSDPFGAERAL